MAGITAAPSGTFTIGGNMTVTRLGFGAMRVTGKGIWGPPEDHDEAIRTLRRLPELGVDFIDTANSYGPDVSEELIREALHPYFEGLVIATKGGLTRSGPNVWTQKGDPDYLIAEAERSREKLGVERIDLWQLHRIDSKVPRDEQFAAIRQLLDLGVIRHAGLSQVSVEEIEAAQAVFPVATVQNRFNLTDRSSADVLDFCARAGIGFMPWAPLSGGALARPGGLLDEVAKRHAASSGQIALAWMLKASPVMLPIPGTSKVRHLEENVAAAGIELSDEEFAALDREGRAQSQAA
ncbi:MAG: aldo/keto reductase [Amaricoccus sp.]